MAITPELYVRTLGPLLIPFCRLMESRAVIAVKSSGESILSSKQSILSAKAQDGLRKALEELMPKRLFIVVSTTNCHEYHRDDILTEEDLSRIRAKGVTVKIDTIGRPY